MDVSLALGELLGSHQGAAPGSVLTPCQTHSGRHALPAQGWHTGLSWTSEEVHQLSFDFLRQGVV